MICHLGRVKAWHQRKVGTTSMHRHPFSIVVSLLLVACSILTMPALAQYATSEIQIVHGIDEHALVALKGNTHPLARAEFDRGSLASDTQLTDLILVLQRPDQQQADFDAFVASQYDSRSPNFHQWLEPEEVGERFGPAHTDVAVVENWLRSHGLQVDELAPDHMSIRFSGSAAQVESAFHADLHTFNVNGEPHIANLHDPSIPAALSPVIAGVMALHNFFPRPLHRIGSRVIRNGETGQWERVSSGNSDPLSVLSAQRAHPDFGISLSGGYQVEDVAPYDFATIYNVLPLWNASTPIDGTGQTIAIAGTSNIHLADIASFRSVFGLPAKVPTVIIANGTNPGTCTSGSSSCEGDLVENTLDVEWAGAVAKGANIILVTAGSNSTTTDTLYASESYVVQHKTASILNVSYGLCELSMGSAGNAQYNNLWQTAASEGIAVFVATGDSGSPSCDQGGDSNYGTPYTASYGLAVSGIASTPYNTAVGGTDFNWGSTASPYWTSTNSTKAASAVGYVPEVPWNDTCANAVILPTLQSYAGVLGISGVTDIEKACNFIYSYSATIDSMSGSNPSWLVDTVGGSGGKSACTVSNGSSSSCSGGCAKPSWQAGVVDIPSDGKRDIPDVSFFASSGFLGSAYLICVTTGSGTCSYSSTSEPTALEIGGTSVASPAMAGVMALINQRAGSVQGSPNGKLYALAAKQTYSACSAESVTTSAPCYFNDIDTGTNGMPCATGSLNCAVQHSGDAIGILSGYSGVTGYDMATGLGSPNVANIVNGWAGPETTTTSQTATPTFSIEAGTYTGTQAVSIVDTMANAIIYYTITGAVPTTSSTKYTGPITVSTTKTIEAIAVASGHTNSAIATAKYTITPPAATPKLSLAPGTYTSKQTVAITDTTAGASIYYTVDGSTPTTSSTKYSAAIAVSNTVTVKAIAIANGYSVSAVVSATYTMAPPAVSPAFSVSAGTYISAQSVALSSTTPGATIYYTTTGTVPNTSSTKYAVPIVVSKTETIEAITVASGYQNSAVAVAKFTVTPPAATPKLSIASGTYASKLTVGISDATAGASIYYTVDGSVPTTSSSKYGAGLSVSTTETLKAIAVANGYSSSEVASATYAMAPSASTPTFSIAAGSYSARQTVAIRDTTAGVAIYYTINGLTPTTASTQYSGPIAVNGTETLQAIAASGSYSSSAVATAKYVITLPAAMPTLSVAAGTYSTARTVAVTSATPGASIYYTSEGTVPTTASAKYSGPLTIAATTMLKAIALANGYSASNAATVVYTIAPTR